MSEWKAFSIVGSEQNVLHRLGAELSAADELWCGGNAADFWPELMNVSNFNLS